MTGIRQRVRISALGCVLTAISLLAIALVAVMVVAAVPDRFGLALSVTAACVPALVYAAIVLRLDRYEAEPLRAVLACFAWGAIGAVLFSVAGSLLFEFAVAEALDYETAFVASIVVGAPLIEETFKGIAVLAVLIFARDEIDSTLDGLVYGALIGVGFAMTENILYFGQAYLEGGFGDFGDLVFARTVLGGLGHPAYTAVTGAAIGWSRSRYGRGFARVLVPFAGWCVAVALHAAWNGGLVFIEARSGGTAGVIEAVAIQAVLVIVPAVLVLYAVARISARNELQILRDHLRVEVDRGTITESEYRTIVDAEHRRRALVTAHDRGGRHLRGRQLAFFHTAAELAFRTNHLSRGEAFTSRQTARDAFDRQRLAILRDELAAAGIPTAAPRENLPLSG